MQLSNLPRDPQTGLGWYDDAHWTPCDGTCGEVFSATEAKDALKPFGNKMLCVSCYPECNAAPSCHAPRLDGGEGGCAVHELEAATETLIDWPEDAWAMRMIALIGGQQ